MDTNGKTSWRFTIRHPNGESLVALVVECEPANGHVPAVSGAANGAAKARPEVSKGDGESKMTEPQKRFIFRLLAAQKVEGRQAEGHLKEYFRVSALGEISKSAASEYINQLTKDRKDAGA